MVGEGGPDRWSRSPQRRQIVQVAMIRPAPEGTLLQTYGRPPLRIYGRGIELTLATIDSAPSLLREINDLSFSHLTFTGAL